MPGYHTLRGILRSALLAALVALAAALAPLRGAAADVSFFGIAKAQQFTQSVGGSPVLLSSNAFSFQSFVIASTNGVVTNATVKPSNTTPLRQLTSDTNGVAWRFDEYFSTQTALDAAYPGSATYTVTMLTVNDGSPAVALNFYLIPPIPISPPTTPAIANLAAAQNIDHTADFTLQFNATGSSLTTIVQLTVLDGASNQLYASAAPFQPGALNGASTSAVIPAYALPPGAVLTAHLTAANAGLPNTNNYPGATGVATQAKDTQFPLTTRPAPPSPLLSLSSLAPSVQVLATALEPNRNYHLLYSTNLDLWTELAVTNNPVGTSVEFTDPDGLVERRLYRMRVGP
jgi:hypothetical protein